ncbi:MAG: ABC transporter permease [Bryobacteraceae bacterium]
MWSEQTGVLQDFTAYDFDGPGVNLTGGDRAEQLKAMHASAGYFRLFGVPMALGRSFSQAEDRPGGGQVAVISNGLWKSRFGGDPSIVGKSIPLGGEPYVVIGVAGAGFDPDPPADVWLPLQADPNSTNQGHYLRAAARLKPGVTLPVARAHLAAAAQEYGRKFPGVLGPKETATADLMQDTIVSNARPALLMLLGAVGFVLLIACANVANLLLVRASGRKREMAIRAAVGANRGRIIRQLMTESVLLAAIGGGLGLLLGFAGVRALLAMNPGNIPRIGEAGAAVTVDWRVAGFTILISLVTGILFGLIPAFSATRLDLSSTLKESASRSGTGLRQNKARGVLVVAEMALALILLAGAALLIRTFVALHNVDPGFDPHHVLTMQTSLTGARFDQTANVAAMVRQATGRIEALPGVETATVTSAVPLEANFGLPLIIEGRALNGPAHGGVSWRYASPGYFDVFKIRILRGRAFTNRDDGAAPGVVLINEGMAKRYWPKQDPLGQRITIGKGVGPAFNEPPRQIIGVVADVHDGGLNRDPFPIVYIPLAQLTNGVMALNNRIIPVTWAIRTKVEPFSLSAPIQREIQYVDRDLAVSHIRSMDQVEAHSTARNDFNTLLLTIFAAAALLLAAIGIYGLMAYTVAQRTQEIGIRIALGAGAGQLRNMVMRQGMTLAAIGIAIGVAAAFGLTRLLASLLFGVKASDPFVFVSVAVILGLVALVASYIPARRATRIDPLVALRYE